VLRSSEIEVGKAQCFWSSLASWHSMGQLWKALIVLLFKLQKGLFLGCSYGNGRRKGGGQTPLDFTIFHFPTKFSSKKFVSFVSRKKNKISPLLALPKKIVGNIQYWNLPGKHPSYPRFTVHTLSGGMSTYHSSCAFSVSVLSGFFVPNRNASTGILYVKL